MKNVKVITDVIVFHCNNAELQGRLLRERTLLKRAVEMSRGSEETKKVSVVRLPTYHWSEFLTYKCFDESGANRKHQGSSPAHPGLNSKKDDRSGTKLGNIKKSRVTKPKLKARATSATATHTKMTLGLEATTRCRRM